MSVIAGSEYCPLKIYAQQLQPNTPQKLRRSAAGAAGVGFGMTVPMYPASRSASAFHRKYVRIDVPFGLVIAAELGDWRLGR